MTPPLRTADLPADIQDAYRAMFANQGREIDGRWYEIRVYMTGECMGSNFPSADHALILDANHSACKGGWISTSAGFNVYECRCPCHDTPAPATTPAVGYLLDENGFPCLPCPRCSGRGSIPEYHKVFHGQCFKCHGSGLIYPTKKIRDEAMACRQELKAAASVQCETYIHYDLRTGDVTRQDHELRPGMAITPRAYTRDEDGNRVHFYPWRTIATVRTTARVTSYGGAALNPDGGHSDACWWLETRLTFTDGTTTTTHGTDFDSQPTPELSADIARRAAASRAHYDKLLARRTDRDARKGQE